MGPKTMWGSKIFWSKQIWCPKTVWVPRNFWSWKILGTQKFWVPEKFWVKKIFGLKTFWSQKNCRSKKFGVPKNFGSLKNLGPKKFWSKVFWVLKNVGSKIILVQNFRHGWVGGGVLSEINTTMRPNFKNPNKLDSKLGQVT